MIDRSDGQQGALLLEPGEGERLDAFGSTIEIKLNGTSTGGSLVVGLGTVPPGLGAPVHRHVNEDEIFLTLEGRFRFLVDGTWKEAGPDSVVYLPRGTVHTFQNIGDTQARYWTILTPSGFESFFGRCAAEFASGGAPDMARLLGICKDHGIEILGPPPEVTHP